MNKHPKSYEGHSKDPGFSSLFSSKVSYTPLMFVLELRVYKSCPIVPIKHITIQLLEGAYKLIGIALMKGFFTQL